MRNCLRALLLGCILFGSAPIAAQSEQLLNDARSMLASDDAEGAYNLLSPLQEEFAGNPVFDLLLGVAAIDSGRPQEAVFMLERVVAVEPDNTLARAELGRAYLRLGELDAARRELEIVRDAPNVPSEAKETITNYLTAFDERARAALTDFRGYLGVDIGYDSNVNAGTDNRIVFVPAAIGGPVFVDIGEGGAETTAGFARFLAGMSFAHQLHDNFTVIAGINASHSTFTDGEEFETGDVNGHLGVVYRQGQNNVTLAYQGDRFSVDDRNNRVANGGIVQWRRVIDELSQVTVHGQFQRLVFRDQAARNANRWTLGVAYSRAFPDLLMAPVAYISVIAGDEQNFADAAPHIGNHFYSVTIGAEARINPQVRMFASAAYALSDYDGPVPGFVSDREDNRYAFQLGGRWEPLADWSITPRVLFTRNDSNTALNDFDRTVVSVLIRRDFD